VHVRLADGGEQAPLELVVSLEEGLDVAVAVACAQVESLLDASSSAPWVLVGESPHVDIRSFPTVCIDHSQFTQTCRGGRCSPAEPLISVTLLCSFH
jgi:hypothetical protein